MKQQTIIIILILIGLAFLAWKFGFPTRETLYYGYLNVPCTYAGCENSVNCPSRYEKISCQGIGTPGGFCECRLSTTDSCSIDSDGNAITPLPERLSSLPSLCLPNKNMVWFCDQAFRPGNYVWQYRCEDVAIVTPPTGQSFFEKYWVFLTIGGLIVLLLILFQMRRR